MHGFAGVALQQGVGEKAVIGASAAARRPLFALAALLRR
jgi:hypothetical protein